MKTYCSPQWTRAIIIAIAYPLMNLVNDVSLCAFGYGATFVYDIAWSLGEVGDSIRARGAGTLLCYFTRVAAISYTRARHTYPFVDYVAGDYRGQQTGQVGQTVGQTHQYSGEPRRYIQMVDFESRVNGAV